jgi:uncharacterized protein (DUF608 family)
MLPSAHDEGSAMDEVPGAAARSAAGDDARLAAFTYRGETSRNISFPLGGIGTGSIGFSGSGRLIDWEIFNRPNKGSVNGYSHFAVKAMDGDRLVDARILAGPVEDRFAGDWLGTRSNTFGFGVRRESLSGMPHFARAEFVGTFPVAELRLGDDRFPGTASVTAFSPFIPLNDRDSSIPAAFFEIAIENNGPKDYDFTVAGSLANPILGQVRAELQAAAGCTLVHLSPDALDAGDPRYGDLSLATDALDTSHQRFWYRGEWFDAIEVYWRDFTSAARFVDRFYPPERTFPLDRFGTRNHSVLAAHFRLAPGERRVTRFALTWNFPNCENYWLRERAERAAASAGLRNSWRNYYATQWADSAASARFALGAWDRLRAETWLFRDALYASSLPRPMLDAVAANLSILKSPTVLRLEDGTFYGWEGVRIDEGSCEGSCTHVWNYAQAQAYLFPGLERSMRDADYRHNLRPDGGMPFRLQLPVGVRWSDERPCPDGQFGGVMKVYRDWKLCGDDAWLRRVWPAAKRSLEYAWSPENEDRWDPDRSGILRGRQHHTLDMELFGPNAWLCGFYLGALKAGAAIAEHLGERESAASYRAMFARGKAWMDENLFNGGYYIHKLDVRDRTALEAFASASGSIIVPGSVMQMYWSDEHGEIKYQIGDGCLVDQVLAQWHATLYGLGEIFDRGQHAKALDAILRHNFIDPISDAYNPCRVFCVDGEAGTVVCTWPEGARKPAIPVVYAQETFHGCEYAFATQLIQTGRIDDAIRVVAAVRDRYDGAKRNPWNEMECGSNYARSLASYALLPALSGFSCDVGAGMLGFAPRAAGQFLWSHGTAWGTYRGDARTAEVAVLGGRLALAELCLGGLEAGAVRAAVAGHTIAVTRAGDAIGFAAPLVLEAGQSVAVHTTASA